MTGMLIDYIEASVEEIISLRSSPEALVVIAGDFNQFPVDVLEKRTGFTLLVHQPTRGANIRDQILVSCPERHVCTSLVNSDHKAFVAYSESSSHAPAKTKTQRTYSSKDASSTRSVSTACFCRCY